MPFHMLEIPIRVQQRHAVFDAERADQQVVGRAHRDAEASQRPIIRRSLDRDVIAGHVAQLELSQRPRHQGRLPRRSDALQHLAQHQIADDQRCVVVVDQGPQASHLPGQHIVELIDPDGRIDNDHSGTRPSRIASRSPVQRTLPPKARISFCARRRISSRSASSTTTFLVGRPSLSAPPPSRRRRCRCSCA
jgi:hypothetical protein